MIGNTRDGIPRSASLLTMCAGAVLLAIGCNTPVEAATGMRYASLQLQKSTTVDGGVIDASIQTADPAPGISIESLLEFAQDCSPEYAYMLLEADAALERIASAGALPDPRLRVEMMRNGSQMHDPMSMSSSSGGKTFRYQLMQEIPWFGKRGLKRDIAGFEAEAARHKATSGWLELSARIKALYAQYYYVSRNEHLVHDILDLFRRMENVKRMRYANGVAAQADAIRAQAEQSAIRNELIMLENEKRMIRTRLNKLLARPKDAPLAEPKRLRALPPQAKMVYAALEDRVRMRNAQISVDEAKVQAAIKNRDLTYKNRYPDVAVGIAPVMEGRSLKEWGVMIELNIPLQQPSRRAQEREAEAMLSAAKYRKEATINQILADLSENLSGLDAARRTEANIAENLLPQSTLAFKAAMVSYENGTADFVALLDAQRQIRMARQSQIKAQAEAQARLAEIERLLGEPI